MEYRASSEFTVRDKAAGVVEVRSNQLEVVDSYRSVFADGIWNRAIARDNKLPKILVDHDGRRAGRVTESRQIRQGSKLFQHSTLKYNLRSEYGAEAFEDVRDGTDDEFSHGFVTLERKFVKIDNEPIERKVEARWFEVSQVLAGASPDTGVISVRSELESLVAPKYIDLAAFLDYRAVAVKDGAPKSPPAGYPEDSSKYGDPTNYKYPLDTDARIHAAVAYYNHSGQREAGGYNAEEWSSIGRRIIAAANKAFGGGYSLDGETIATSGGRSLSHETDAIAIEEERAGKAISAANQTTLQKAHDTLAGLPGVQCDAANVAASDNDGDETYSMARILEEARSGLSVLGIESDRS